MASTLTTVRAVHPKSTDVTTHDARIDFQRVPNAPATRGVLEAVKIGARTGTLR